MNDEPPTIADLTQNPRCKYVRTPLAGTAQQATISKTHDFRPAIRTDRSIPIVNETNRARNNPVLLNVS